MDIRWPRRRWIPYVVLVVGVACTAGVCLQISRVQHARDRERFARAVLKTGSDIEGRMETYIAMLRAATGLFAASEYVNREEFARFIDRLQLHTAYPGIQGIGYSERATSAVALIDHLRAEYGAEFILHSPPDAPEFHAVIFLEPLDAINRLDIGYNMFVEENRREAMEKARDAATPVASGLVTISQQQGPDRQRGFLIYVPFYSTPGAPGTIEERRRNLVGFIYAPFRVHDLFGTIFAESSSPAEFALYDSPNVDPDALIFASPRYVQSREAADALHASTTLIIAERMWTASLVPGDAFASGRARGIIPLVAGCGALVSLLLFGLVRVQTLAAERFEHQAQSLRESQQELSDSEARKSAILESALDAIISMDHLGRVIEWNPAAERIFGWSRRDAVGRPLDELIIPERVRSGRPEAVWNVVGSASGPATGQRVETTAHRADGSEFPVEMSICRIGETEPPRFTGFIRDITERVRAEHHRELMTRELDHRVKNNLATVLAIVGESGRRSPSVPEVVRSVNGRLRALAGLHEMLAARKWQGAELGELVTRTLAPHRAIVARAEGPPQEPDPQPEPPDSDGRVNIAGPPVTLSGRIASSVCMALHELATNASKYGALSAPGGRVDISWHVEPGDAGAERLLLTWKERGGPPVRVPSQRGFGSELIEGGIAFETGGHTTIDFAPTGVVCQMCIPLHPAEAGRSPPEGPPSSLR